MDWWKCHNFSRSSYRENVVIGAGSVVTRDIHDNTIAVGNPYKVIKENK